MDSHTSDPYGWMDEPLRDRPTLAAAQASYSLDWPVPPLRLATDRGRVTEAYAAAPAIDAARPVPSSAS